MTDMLFNLFFYALMIGLLASAMASLIVIVWHGWEIILEILINSNS